MDINRLRALAGTPVRETSPRRGEAGAMSNEELTEYVAELVDMLTEVKTRIARVAPELGLDGYDLVQITNEINRLIDDIGRL